MRTNIQSNEVVRESKEKNKAKKGKLKRGIDQRDSLIIQKGKAETPQSEMEEISFQYNARMFPSYGNRKNDNRMIMMCFLPLSVFLFYPHSHYECSF